MCNDHNGSTLNCQLISGHAYKAHSIQTICVYSILPGIGPHLKKLPDQEFISQEFIKYLTQKCQEIQKNNSSSTKTQEPQVIKTFFHIISLILHIQ